MAETSLTDPVRSVSDSLDRYCDGPVDWPIAVALSGGSDSHALLRLAALWAACRGRSLIALTVDHQLNPDSAHWTRRAAEMAAAVGVPWQALAWTATDKPVRGLQAAARTARYSLLSHAARDVGARVILVGHTQDDGLENARMRATDTPGIGGIYPWRPVPVWPEGRGLMLCRPMLELRRQALRDWLSEKGLSWIEDPANANPAFARVRARQALIGEAQVSPPGTVLDSRAAYWLAIMSFDWAGAMTLARTDVEDQLSSHGAGTALRVLSAMVLCASGQSTPPRHEALQPILELLRTAGSDAVRTLCGAQITLAPDRMSLCREFGRTRPLPMGVGAGETVIWDGRFEVTVQQAGTLVPALGRLKALSPSDQARLRAIAPMARLSLPVLLTEDGAVTCLPDLRPLAPERLRASLGAIRCESDLRYPNTD